MRPTRGLRYARLGDGGGSTVVIVIVIVVDLLVMGRFYLLSLGRGHPGKHHGLHRGEERSPQVQRTLEASLCKKKLLTYSLNLALFSQ